jgi:hypothetical protein
MDGAAGSGAMSPEECRGFPFEGLIYSPGGDVLPNTCEPFHPTLNNPYAVRCIDAWPWYTTKFPGDEACLLPPPPDKGVQYGTHPQGKAWFDQVSKGDMSGYDNLDTAWTMEPGEEENANYHTSISEPAFKYFRSYVRMRGGSHHMIVTAEALGAMTEHWQGGSPDFFGTSLPGAQRPDENVPKSLAKPPEDAELYGNMPSPTGVLHNFHHFNVTDGQTMKESWTNLWFEEGGTVQIRPIFGLNLSQAVGLAVPPNSAADLHYSWPISTEMRLVMIFGHRHSWTTNFSAWRVKAAGEVEILYQSFDWFDEPTYRYDSLTENPVPDYTTLTDGAASGIVTLMPGETVHFNCHIEYTEEQAAAEGGPSPTQNGTLRFANEAFTAEMCIMFGSTTGGSLLNPAPDTSPLPDFAKR